MKAGHVHLYVVAVACAFFGSDPRWGFCAHSPWWTFLTYHFAHGNVLHLAANLLVAFWLLLHRDDRWWLFPSCMLAASLLALALSPVTRQATVGLSAMLLVYYGFIVARYGRGGAWRNVAYMLAYLVVSSLFSTGAVALHWASWTAGVAAGLVGRFLYDMERKEKMYDR